MGLVAVLVPAGLVLTGALSLGCATSASGAPRNGAAHSAPAQPMFTALVEITEPNATVAMSLSPLVFSAGPATLFVPRSTVRCQAEMALVADRVCVDKWEATLVRVVAGKEVSWSPFADVDDMTPRTGDPGGEAASFRAVSRAGVVPQGYVSGQQAERACRSSGKRLCTTDEWELGCRGPSQAQFPYGNERRANVCNDDVRAKHPVLEAARQQGLPREKAWLDGMNLPAVNQLPDTLARTGERAECASSDGLFDMVGNLHEWVADADGTFRGGYYMDTTKNGDGCSYRTTAHDFGYHDYSTGFRCCADPEPIE